MSNKTAKDLAWDRERAKYRHQINELKEKCRLLTAENEEVNALLKNAETVINKMRGVPVEDLARFLQVENEKVKRDKEVKAALESLLNLRRGFF